METACGLQATDVPDWSTIDWSIRRNRAFEGLEELTSKSRSRAAVRIWRISENLAREHDAKL